ncbi:MAG: hypothetical protein GY839_18960, partial [candidate division Zixibacteria bacterium]|nr:hypothetical protein [candidate division Zixibacteria bacterium]
ALCLEQTSGPSTILHTKIESASTGSDSSLYPAAISAFQSALALDQVIFEDCRNSLYARSGNISVRACTFVDLVQEAAIHFDSVENGIIRDNLIFDSLSYGLIISGQSSDIRISGNTIYDCREAAIVLAGASTAIIDRNVMAGSSVGILAKDGSGADLSRNTFYGNDVSMVCLEENSGLGGASLNIIDTIISNSSTSAISIDDGSNANISFSLCDTELLAGEGNLSANPKFFSAADRNFSLRTDSPCINAGSPNSPLDPDGTRADMGAIYYDLTSFNFIIINEINYNSANDFNPEDWIEFYNRQDLTLNLSGWSFQDEDDEHIFIFPDSSLIAANDYLVLCRNISRFSSFFPLVDNSLGNFDFGLSGSGEQIRLYDAAGHLVDSLSYDDREPWPVEADGNGATLELKHTAFDNNIACNWAASPFYGTPGGPNDDLPETIFLQNPAHNSRKVDLSPTFTWSMPAKNNDNAISCLLEIALDNDFNLPIESRTTADTSLTLDLELEPLSDYYWRITASAGDNCQEISRVNQFTTGVLIPANINLQQNYPNPFNTITTIRFGIPTDSPVRITIYNILGQKVKTLTAEIKPAGYHQISWDGTNNNGQTVANRLYFYQLKVNEYQNKMKMILLK